MSGCSIIKRNGKEIFYFDNRGLSGPELIENLNKGDRMMQESGKTGLLALADFTDTVVSEEVFKYLKSETVAVSMKLIGRAAVVGLTGAKKILLTVFNAAHASRGSAYIPFESLAEAKKYLFE